MTDPESRAGAPRFEIAVVGGGPAGLSAALAGARMNRRTVCFETGTPRTAHAPLYHNYLGFPDGISGRELLEAGRAQARQWGCELRDEEVIAIERLDGEGAPGFVLRTARGALRSRGLVLATGIEDRQPRCGNLYGETGIHYCVVCDGYETRGERVAVVGHDDRAFAMIKALRDFTFDLHLLLDGRDARLSDEERSALAEWKVEVRQACLDAYRCSEEGVRFRLGDGSEEVYPHVFVALGVEPRTALARDLGCELDGEGFIVTDGRQATNVAFVYAAGDCDGGHKQVTQAMAEGERAVLELTRLLRRTAGPAQGVSGQVRRGS